MHQKRLVIAMGLCLSVGLTGCFGGSSSSNGETDPDNDNGADPPENSVVTNLDSLNGLNGDADNDNLLFYFGNDFADGNLRAIRPEDPQSSTGYTAGGALFLGTSSIEPIVAGDWDPTEMDLTDIQTTGIVYTGDDEVRFLDAEDESFPPSAEKVIGGEDFTVGGAFWFRGLAQNPEDPLETAMLALGKTTADPLFLFSLSDKSGADPFEVEEFSDEEGHRDAQFAAIRDVENLEPQGWLKAMAEDDDETLRFLGTDGEDLGEIQNASTVLDNPTQVRIIGDVMPDGSYYLDIRIDDHNEHNLFVLEPEDSAPAGETLWSIHAVSFEDQSEVDIQSDLDPIGVVLSEAWRGPVRIAYGDDNDLFFANDSLNVDGSAVYRIRGRSVETVAEAEGDNFRFGQLFRGPESIIWFTGDGGFNFIKQIALDDLSVETIADTGTDGSDFGNEFFTLDEYDTNVKGHRDGWIFYNLSYLPSAGSSEKEAAIARNLNGDGYFAIEDAEWVGSSHDGSLGEGSLLGDGHLSEVFLMTRDSSDNRHLAAVDASDPEAGMVELGRLPNGTETVNEYGRSGGPHRLFQAEIDNGDEQVVYVNTREEDSLEIVDQAGNSTQPVNGF